MTELFSATINRTDKAWFDWMKRLSIVTIFPHTINSLINLKLKREKILKSKQSDKTVGSKHAASKKIFYFQNFGTAGW